MKIRESSRLRKKFLERLRSHQEAREGVHVSDLLYCVRQAWHSRNGTPPPEDSALLLWLRGHSHQNLLSGKKNREVQVRWCAYCDVIHDGHTVRSCSLCGSELLIGTKDWMYRGVPVEFKSTLKSSKSSLEDLPWYRDQAVFYAVMTGEDRAIVVVYHVYGSYGQRPEPELRVYEITEIDVVDRERIRLLARERMQRLLADTEPPLDEHSPAYDWVCQYCHVITCVRHPSRKRDPEAVIEELIEGSVQS